MKFDSPKVSVIIPNYNYAAYVGNAIESVLQQTYSNFEVIVVDNGSEDNSLGLLRQFGERITLIAQENRGQSGARNAGLLAATGDLIAFLDADDLWEPTKLEKQIKLITRETQLVYSGLIRFESISGKSLSVAYPDHKGACRNRFVENPGVAVVVGGESTVLLTHELVIKVGEFDPNLDISAGWDFFRRCSAYTNFDYVPELLTRYRIHGGNMSSNSINIIQDIRKSFFKLVASDCQAFSLLHLLRAYLRLEWSFYKTHLRHHSLKESLISLAKFPFYLYSFFWNYKLGDL